MESLATLTDPGHAELVLHPLRRRIMEAAAHAPISASGAARSIGEPRQKVNYHLRSLVDAGLLEPAGERQKRGLTEKLYRASARSYALSADVLGRLAPTAESLGDSVSAATLLSLAARTRSEVAEAAEQARAEGKRLATLSIDTEVRFESAAQQSAFAEALGQAVADVVARHSVPASTGRGHRYRLITAAYPPPRSAGGRGLPAPEGRSPGVDAEEDA